ncbi:MAG: helix-turn-helix transcriptional regulator [Ruminococcaceae bacterium]|nr:helix-turn-helix transcriptional regulator [Oscillospiraceae bacterium]
MDIQSLLEKALKAKGWTRYKLSKSGNIPESTLTNIFTRGNCPTISTLEIICNTLGITLSQFFSENELIEVTPEIKELLDNWLYLNTKQKQAVLQTIKAMKNDSVK